MNAECVQTDLFGQPVPTRNRDLVQAANVDELHRRIVVRFNEIVADRRSRLVRGLEINLDQIYVDLGEEFCKSAGTIRNIIKGYARRKKSR